MFLERSLVERTKAQYRFVGRALTSKRFRRGSCGLPYFILRSGFLRLLRMAPVMRWTVNYIAD
jgi:hypothetical protein